MVKKLGWMVYSGMDGRLSSDWRFIDFFEAKHMNLYQYASFELLSI